MKVTRTKLADQVYLTWLPAQKFKTSLLSAQFITPIRQETAPAYALLPSVLRRGTVRYPDMGSLSRKLDTLYGARIDGAVRKIAECQCLGFVASHIDDRFTPGGEQLLEPVAELLGELVCDPATEGGRFVSDYFESEKTNLIDAIRSILNDKRTYADRRLLQELCAGEAYSIHRLGDEKEAQRLQPRKLYALYRELISTARLELFYCGSAELPRVEQALRAAFASLPRAKTLSLPVTKTHPPRTEPRSVTERLDVTQGKLGMGFSCDTSDFPAMMLGNVLFGGSSNSRLFLNVREKLSLCYYASSVLHRSKGVLTVASGIEFENYQRAYDEILAQLDAVRRCDLEDWELEAARSTMRNAYASMGDSQAKLENYFLSQTATGQHETPEELSAQMQAVSLERIRRAMESVRLDTVYFLQGKEAAE